MSFTAERIRLSGKVTATPQYLRPQQDEYWKLQASSWPGHTQTIKALLEQRGYATAAIKSPEWLRESMIRSELGQMSYVPYSNTELREFIAARDINAETVITKRAKGLRKELIQLLDQADQHPQFHKFMSLPPEIRNRIYAMYFAEFNKPLCAPLQPPLTFTSSQVRGETLQMFYSSCQFEIGFVQHRERSRVRPHPFARLRLPDKTLLWFQSLSHSSLLSLRRLRFDFHSHEDPHFMGDWRHDANFQYGRLGWFELEVVQRDGQGGLQLFFPEGPSMRFPTRLYLVRAAVRRVVGRINAREGSVCLTVDDLKAMRKAMEA